MEMYANIRELLGIFIGKRLVDVTQHDKDEWDATKCAYILLMFDDGSAVKFLLGDDTGFTVFPPGEYEGAD